MDWILGPTLFSFIASFEDVSASIQTPFRFGRHLGKTIDLGINTGGCGPMTSRVKVEAHKVYILVFARPIDLHDLGTELHKRRSGITGDSICLDATIVDVSVLRKQCMQSRVERNVNDVDEFTTSHPSCHEHARRHQRHQANLPSPSSKKRPHDAALPLSEMSSEVLFGVDLRGRAAAAKLRPQ